MRSFKALLMAASSLGLLFLGACSSGNQTATTASSPVATPSIAASAPVKDETVKTDGAMKENDHSEAKQGGQVIEVGAYHLEFVPEKEAELSHLDFYLLKGETHTPVPDAKVTAQLQLPDGSQKLLPMTYDPAEKHYTAKLPGTVAGAYKVAILSDIKGEKVNGRFSFSR